MPRASQRVVSDDEFDDEDLDQLDESDHEEVSNTQTAAKANNLLFGALQKPRPVTVNCKQLYELMHHGNINLNPEYQRDVVWPITKQMGLIQSLFLNYYVPPLIFALHIREEDGVEIRTAIDGKQRCSSIQYFIDGRVPYVAPDRTRFWYRIPPDAKGGKLLPEALKRRFDMISLMVVEYDNVPDDVQRDIFQRVQMGVALTSAEKLQAIASPWTTWLSELLKKYVFHPGTLRDSFTWDTTRGKPFQTFASIAIWCQDPDAITNLSPPKYKAFLDRQDPPDDGFRKRFEKAISLLIRMAQEYFEEVFDMGVVAGRSSKIVSPVELWFMGFIVYSRMGQSSLRGLAQTCRDLRQFARQKEKDLFTNKKTIALLRDWLHGQAVVKPGRDEVVAAVEWEHHDDLSDMRQASKKRRREERELEEDPDYQGGPVARGTKSHAAEHTRSRRATKGIDDTAPGSSRKSSKSSAPAISPSAKTSAALPNPAPTPRVKTEPGHETASNPPSSAPAGPRSATHQPAPPPPQQPRWANTATRPPPIGMDAQYGVPQGGPNYDQASPSVSAAQVPLQNAPYGATGFDPRRANGFTSQQPQQLQQPYQQQQQQYQQSHHASGQNPYASQTYGSQYGQQGWNGGR